MKISDKIKSSFAKHEPNFVAQFAVLVLHAKRYVAVSMNFLLIMSVALLLSLRFIKRSVFID